MSKIKDLPNKSVLDADDVIYVVDDAVGVNGGRKTKVSELKSSIASTDAEIKTQYENNANSNEFSDAEETKLANVSLDGIAQKVIVQKIPAFGEFGDIQAAIDSITDASLTKPYNVSIGPGQYDISQSIVTKKNVNIIGHGVSTIINQTDETKSCITGIDGIKVSSLALKGSGIGGSAVPLIRYNGSSTISAFRLDNISFGDCYSFLESNNIMSTPSIIVMRNCAYNGSEITKGIIQSGSGAGLLYLSDFTANFILANETVTDMFTVTGSLNRMVLVNIASLVTAPATADIAFKITDGGTMSTQTVGIDGYNKGLCLPNLGAAPSIEMSGITILNSTTLDVEVLHPSASGYLSGAFDEDKTTIDVNSTVISTHLDPVNGGFSIVGTIKQGDESGRVTDISQFIREGGVTGLIEGGVITAGVGLSLDCTSGCGYLRAPTGNYINQVPFTAQSVALTDGINNFISVNENGILQSTGSPPPFEDVLFLGRAVTRNGVVLYIENAEVSMVQYAVEAEKFFRFTLGPIYRGSGSQVSENGTRGLDVTPGIYNFGIKAYAPVGFTAGSWDAFYRDGAGGDTQILSQSTVDNALYDDNSGTLAAITAGKFVKHSLYTVGDGSDEYWLLQYGQELFDTQLLAQGGDIPLTGSAFAGSVTLVATIIIQEGQSNIIEIRDERPVLQFKASGTSASSSHSGLLDLDNPADHAWAFLVDGTRPMGGNLDVGTNNIVNLGTANGVTIENHNARHEPNAGTDALVTAAPTTALSGSSTNATGIGNAFSRNDHSHQILEATAILSGLLPAGKFTDIENNKTHTTDTTTNPHGRSKVIRTDYIEGTTSSPSTTATSSGTAPVIAEMEDTFTPAAADDVIDVFFSGTFGESSTGKDETVFIGIFVDSVLIPSTVRSQNVKGVTDTDKISSFSTQWSGSLSVASHTIDVRFWIVGAVGATAVAIDNRRNLIVKETDE